MKSRSEALPAKSVKSLLRQSLHIMACNRRTQCTPITPSPKNKVELLQLPNEILLLVFEDLHNEHVLSLSLVCRRLNHLALPCYFLRHGMPGKPHEFHDANISALAGFQVSLFTTRLRRISLTIDFPETKLFRLTRRLMCMISNLVNVEEVKLEVADLSDWRDLDAWNKIFQDLLQLIVNKSCLSLEVGGLAEHGSASSALLRKDPVIVSSRRLSNSPRRNISGRMETFTIHCPSLLRPPYFDWTLKTINSCPIADLTLDWRNGLDSAEVCASVLKQIHLPRLCRLSIRSARIQLKDIWEFAIRHPTIVNLALRTSTRQVSWCKVPILAFPQLKSLEINIQLASRCFDRQVTFPRLRRIALSTSFNHFDIHGGKNLFYKNLDDALLLVSKRTYVVTLSLDIRRTDADAWMLDRAEHKVDSGPAGPPLKSITRLELRLGGFDYDALTASLPKWLSSAFPFLKALILERPFLMEQDIMAFVQLIHSSCPQVKTVGVNGEECSITEWFDSIQLSLKASRDLVKNHSHHFVYKRWVNDS